MCVPVSLLLPPAEYIKEEARHVGSVIKHATVDPVKHAAEALGDKVTQLTQTSCPTLHRRSTWLFQGHQCRCADMARALYSLGGAHNATLVTCSQPAFWSSMQLTRHMVDEAGSCSIDRDCSSSQRRTQCSCAAHMTFRCCKPTPR